MSDIQKVMKGLQTCIKPGLEHCTSECPYFNKDDYRYECVRMKSDAIELLKKQEELVRCKDCKHSVDYSALYYARPYRCEKHSWFREADWFCADGERR